MTKANCVKLFTNNLKDTVLYGISMPCSTSYLWYNYQNKSLLGYGGDKMIEPVDDGANFLNGKFVEENQVEILTIESLAKVVQREYADKDGSTRTEQKVEVDVICDDQNQSKKLWSMNKTSRNIVIAVFGKDEAKWIGKQVPITTQGTDKGTAIYPHKVRFEKMYAIKGTLD